MDHSTGDVVLDAALTARALHGVQVNGTCGHCLPAGTPWPCPAFQRVQAIVDGLTSTGGDYLRRVLSASKIPVSH